MSEIFLTPAESGDIVQLSQTMFRKQILPLGTINYRGADGKARKITFDKKYLTDLAESYQGKAYDQVAAMMADGDNRHTMDPRYFGGEVREVEVTDKGLYGVFQLTDEAAKVVKNSGGKVGVSARILEGVERNDGTSTKQFARALQHVLITTDPKISGLDAWSEVSLSGYDGNTPVTDLTDTRYEGNGDMPDNKLDVATVTPEQLREMSDEEFAAIPEDEISEIFDRFLAEGLISENTDDTTAEVDDDDEELDVTDLEPQLATLSNQTLAALELSTSHAIELATLRQELADTRFSKESAELARRGVPPALLELARPLLSEPDIAVVELSNSEKVDVAGLVRKLLKETAGFIELAKERGHSLDLSEQSDDAEADALVDAWAKQTDNN